MTVSGKKKITVTRRTKPLNEKHIMAFFFSVALLLSVFLAVLLGFFQQLNLPGIKNVSNYRPLQATLVLDRHGAIVDRVFIENRVVIGLDQMPPLLPKAFVAAEDGRFYEHPGLDLYSVLRALVNNIRAGRKSQGGSTITQQVAKGLLLSSEKTYLRKFKEAMLAWRIDTLLTKDEILYIYLNHIYLGSGAYGVEAAAQTYFGKPAARLDLAEMALLAGLPQAPSRYSPKQHWQQAHARQRYVLNRMVADGYISPEEAQTAHQRRPALIDDGSAPAANGYYLAEVRRRSQKMIGRPLETAAVRIHTNLDQRVQRAAQRAIRDGLDALVDRRAADGEQRTAPEGALVGLELCSGKVRALVGGSDFATTPFNRTVQAQRPAGSVFKPLLYGAAFERRLTPQTSVVDEPISITGADGRPWRPQNFSGRFHGSVTLGTALIHSYNIPAIKVMQQIGVRPVHEVARKAGITTDLPPDLSLALGAVDVSPLEMTAAYLPFVCDGIAVQPTLIERITEGDGREVYQARPERQQALSNGTAEQIKQLLVRVITEGTGREAAGLTGTSGGKTGTSDENRDAWFIGFHERLLAGVWIGHDRNQSLGRGENGGHTAAPIWRRFMSTVAAGK
ncbi:MAG: PBP1A family penicillin-binding protein [Desulfofustis sp.]|nr:PBP1A family penicillin-binding protein [Desulfofustis sp.]